MTKFQELTGDFVGQDQRVSFRQVNLQGGVLRSNGSVEVTGGNLSGRLNIEIRSQVAADRSPFGLSGTVSRPILRRGG